MARRTLTSPTGEMGFYYDAEPEEEAKGMSMNQNGCAQCGAPSTHYQRKYGYLCCRCHVESGGSPADWHQECIGTHRRIHEKLEGVEQGFTAPFPAPKQNYSWQPLEVAAGPRPADDLLAEAIKKAKKGWEL